MLFSEAQGTTHYPAIPKKPVSANDVFAELGFTAVTAGKSQALGYDVTEHELENSH